AGPEDTDRAGRGLARERRGEVAVPLPRVDRHERAPGLGLRGVLLPQERLLVDDRRRLDDRAVDRQPQWTDVGTELRAVREVVVDPEPQARLVTRVVTVPVGDGALEGFDVESVQPGVLGVPAVL